MPCRLHLTLAAALLAGSPSLHAQEAVVGASDPDALFHRSDPKLNTNTQVAYHIVKDLLEAGHWELADKYLTERYIQHNPNAASGRKGVVKFFTEVRKVKPVPAEDEHEGRVGGGGGRSRGGRVCPRAEGRQGVRTELHHNLVRYVAFQGWQSGRTLGSGDAHRSMIV